MKKKVYLINPQEADIGYFRWPSKADSGRTDYIYVADLATTTVATMMQPYFEVEICEASLFQVDYDTDAEFIAITGKISQWNHMVEISTEFRKRGKTIILGGSYASLSYDRVRSYCDILVRGEIENIADEMFKEIASGNWKSEYEGTQADLAKTPLPNWSLYPNEKALLGSVQISRGCPFQCEFCDVIEYLGRNQRHKSVENIINELDSLYAHGYRDAFIADDNLTVYRKKAKEILQAIGDWNKKQTDGRMNFVSQVSIDVARDAEIMNLATYAGLYSVFIGIETPNVESLKETRKLQNVHVNLVEQLKTVYNHGLGVYGGLIVGFDNDKPEIFEQQFEFVMETSMPYVTYGLLNAPDQTPLYDRLKKDNRLVEDHSRIIAGNPYESNIIFKNITQEEAELGSIWLMNNLYDANNFGERLSNFTNELGDRRQNDGAPLMNFRPVHKEMLRIIRNVRKLGEDEARLHDRFIKLGSKNPHAMLHLINYMNFYASVRSTMHNNETWRPYLAGSSVFEKG